MTTNTVETNPTPLPRAVREQMLRINAKLEAKPEGTPPPPPPNAAGETPPSPSADSPDGLTPPAPPAPPVEGDPRENDPAYWKQRFQVTQGMLRSAQERMAQRDAERDRQITELQDKVRSFEAKKAPEKVDITSFFSPEQIERFGEEQCEAMATTALTAASQEAQRLIETEVRPIREREQRQAEQTQAGLEATFWEKLAELQPNYQEINARQDWLAWLADQDEATGMVRQRILNDHHSALNATGVAKLFRTFEAGLKPTPTPPVAPAKNAAAGGAPPAPPAASAKGYPTRDEIRDYYKRKAINRVTEQEQAEFEERLRTQAAA